MIDKLSKKRIRVDYESMIIYLHLDADFIRYVFSHNNKISMRRLALGFLRRKKVDIEGVYFEMKEKGFSIDQDKSDFWCPFPSDVKSSIPDDALHAEIDNTPDFFRGY